MQAPKRRSKNPRRSSLIWSLRSRPCRSPHKLKLVFKSTRAYSVARKSGPRNRVALIKVKSREQGLVGDSDEEWDDAIRGLGLLADLWRRFPRPCIQNNPPNTRCILLSTSLDTIDEAYIFISTLGRRIDKKRPRGKKPLRRLCSSDGCHARSVVRLPPSKSMISRQLWTKSRTSTASLLIRWPGNYRHSPSGIRLSYCLL